jgi:hypothetical protein
LQKERNRFCSLVLNARFNFLLAVDRRSESLEENKSAPASVCKCFGSAPGIGHMAPDSVPSEGVPGAVAVELREGLGRYLNLKLRG